MARRKKHDEGHENHERWLLTYSDMITLLMIFFIVLYSQSQVDTVKFKALSESLSISMGNQSAAKVQIQKESGKLDLANLKPATKDQNQGDSDIDSKTIQGIKKKVDDWVAKNGLEGKVSTNVEERGLVVSIRDTILFPSGSATLTPEANSILQKLSGILNNLTNYIKVEGHTDNVPIHTPQFPSNWELSVMRGVNVVNVLIANGCPPDKLSATGYGEYRPVVANNSDDNRGRNRRVDLVIMRSKYDVTEPTLSKTVSDEPLPYTGGGNAGNSR